MASPRLRPDSPQAHNNLANALAAPGRTPEALAHFETALRFQPDYADAHYNFAKALTQAGRVPEAQAHYEAALRLHPTDADAHNNLGSLWLAQERPAEALGEFRAAASAAARFSRCPRQFRTYPTGALDREFVAPRLSAADAARVFAF